MDVPLKWLGKIDLHSRGRFQSKILKKFFLGSNKESSYIWLTLIRLVHLDNLQDTITCPFLFPIPILLSPWGSSLTEEYRVDVLSTIMFIITVYK